VIAGLADRVMVMYAGFVVEEALVDELYENPQHPYSIGLLGSLPRVDYDQRRRLASIEGLPPVLLEKPGFCPFLNRCRYAVEHCRIENPPLLEVAPGHQAACWVDPTARKERA
jgi:oligopeptide transport system ATP-binding protein